MNDADVDIYLLDLDVGDLAAATSILSADEQARAARFHFDVHRHRFIRGRAALRRILGRDLSIDPQSLDFQTMEFGKPVLDRSFQLGFNLAHCESRGIIALGWRRELGVDIELLRPVPDRAALEISHFSLAERKALDLAPADQRDRMFFRCWTRKEAHLKLLGIGIARELTEISVGIDDDSELNVSSMLHSADLADDTIVAIASDRAWSQLRFETFSA